MIQDEILKDMKRLRAIAESTDIRYGFWSLMMDAEACIQGKRTILPPDQIDQQLRETIAEIKRRSSH
ncbi:hypothetical protein [Aestuariivirga litoralis]|uniref:hypothetical protein n=1 Tax=Aestuariivirga litoralis TaxID=2650924 RepID=UPI0018C791AF|nr:hypothetical protein [Aestuariivirga litoralis]MBG1231480.1 hypothetical protein [Aestuariivirga litoralis]